MNQRFDAVILGAGPAGSAAGIGLAGTGMRVLIIELSEFPRHRPGESLHPGLGTLFEKLGVHEAIESAGFHRFTGQQVHWDMVQEFVPFGKQDDGEWLGYQAPREIIDGLLLDRARAAGCQIWQPCRVATVNREHSQYHFQIATDLGDVSGDWLFDATGRSQLLTRQLGLRWKHFSHQLIVRYGYVPGVASRRGQNKQDIVGSPSIRKDEEGWTWLADLGNQRIAWVRLRFDGADPGEDWLPVELRDRQVAQSSRGADVTHRIANQTAGTRWFLLGDAACVLDPASSHGLLRAVMTGMQAAHLAICCEKGRTSTRSVAYAYHQWIYDWFCKDRKHLLELYPESFSNQFCTAKS